MQMLRYFGGVTFMKRILCHTITLLCLTIALSSSYAAGDTAYSAMRTVAAQRGEKSLQGMIELTGIQGSPQPLVWRIVVADATARGGLREYEVSGGRILSERTPVRPSRLSASFPIRVANLNVDSDSAFLAAVEQAKRMQIGFDSANYTLTSRDEIGNPLWNIDLLDIDGELLATVRLSATDGVILNTSSADSQTQAPWQDNQGMGGFLGRTSDALNSAGKATKRTFLKGAGNVQEWLTGKRTIGEPE